MKINFWQVDREMIAAAMQDQLNLYPAMKACEFFILYKVILKIYFSCLQFKSTFLKTVESCANLSWKCER